MKSLLKISKKVTIRGISFDFTNGTIDHRKPDVKNHRCKTVSTDRYAVDLANANDRYYINKFYHYIFTDYVSLTKDHILKLNESENSFIDDNIYREFAVVYLSTENLISYKKNKSEMESVLMEFFGMKNPAISVIQKEQSIKQKTVDSSKARHKFNETKGVGLNKGDLAESFATINRCDHPVIFVEPELYHNSDAYSKLTELFDCMQISIPNEAQIEKLNKEGIQVVSVESLKLFNVSGLSNSDKEFFDYCGIGLLLHIYKTNDVIDSKFKKSFFYNYYVKDSSLRNDNTPMAHFLAKLNYDKKKGKDNKKLAENIFNTSKKVFERLYGQNFVKTFFEIDDFIKNHVFYKESSKAIKFD